MPTPTDSVLLRIYIGEAARHKREPLHEAVVLKAREMHLAGATVIRGAMGYGKSSLLHTTKVLRLSDDLPLVIEILDSEEKINAFLPVLEEMMPAGVATLDRVRAVHFQGPSAPP
jgi:PII-like signaling protein